MKLENFNSIWAACSKMHDLVRDIVENYQTDALYDSVCLCKLNKDECGLQVFRKNGTNWYSAEDEERALENISDYWENYHMLVKWTCTGEDSYTMEEISSNLE